MCFLAFIQGLSNILKLVLVKTFLETFLRDVLMLPEGHGINDQRIH